MRKLLLASMLTLALFGCSDASTEQDMLYPDINSFEFEQKTVQERSWLEWLLWEDPNPPYPPHGHSH